MSCDKGLGNLLGKLDEIAKVLTPEVMAEMNLQFPEIAVVGQQSVGKSSVLERITVRGSFTLLGCGRVGRALCSPAWLMCRRRCCRCSRAARIS